MLYFSPAVLYPGEPGRADINPIPLDGAVDKSIRQTNRLINKKIPAALSLFVIYAVRT